MSEMSNLLYALVTSQYGKSRMEDMTYVDDQAGQSSIEKDFYTFIVSQVEFSKGFFVSTHKSFLNDDKIINFAAQ